MTEPRPVKAVVSLHSFPRDGSVRTLGWGVAAWVHGHLLQPDGDDSGEPFRFTREQLNFTLWFYAVDAAGRYVYRRAVLRRAKGWGKSPFMAAICLAELCGPVRFGHWGADGEPVGVPHSLPWVVIAGVSEEQTKNTLDAVRAMVEESDLVASLGLDVSQTRILMPGGGKLVTITASAATQEGARPTFAVLDETHHWSATNGGRKLAAVLKRNLAKSRGGAARSIETTNAHEPGQESVAEASYLAHRAMVEGRTRAQGLLYDSREAPDWVPLQDEPLLRQALVATYGDATWLDLDRILGEIYDPDTTAEESRRFYLNQIIAAADAWVTPAQWGANAIEGLALEPGDVVTLGFDGGKTDDSTALVACRLSDSALFLLAIWEKPEGPAGIGWEVERDAVTDAVGHAFATYDVVAFASDVNEWETVVDEWAAEYREKLLVKAVARHAVAWDMRGHGLETTKAVEALHRAIAEHGAPHPVDPIFARHINNARRRPNRYGISFGKESRESPRKVDAVAAAVLARMMAVRVLAEGVLAKRKTRTGSLRGY